MIVGELCAEARRLHFWLFEHALPFWSTIGHDGTGRGFVEHLGLDAVPADVDFKRLRVQARQVAVYSQAYGVGFAPGLAVARDGFDFIVAHAIRSDGGVCKLLTRSGAIKDAAEDLYDTAFVLFACGCFAKASGDPRVLAVADAIFQRLVKEHCAPDGMGFFEAYPCLDDRRLQNPHMHLFEAMLALSEAAPGASNGYMDVADRLVALFLTHLFDASSGTVSEVFDKNWQRPPAEADWIEPGHLYEWVTLLLWYVEQCRARGREAKLNEDVLGGLLAWAGRFGHRPGDDRVIAAVTRDGLQRDLRSRVWHQTEAIRAHALVLDSGRAASVGRLVSLLRGFRLSFLSQEPTGVWTEALDADDTPTETRIPASSLYHIMGAYLALDRLIRLRT